MAYEQLASVTYARWGVNGRTVLDTQGRLAGDDRSGWLRFLPRVKKRTMVVITGLLLAAVGIGLEVLVELSGMPSGASAMSEEFKAALKAVGHFAMPAAWGGLGACVFLAKRMSDKWTHPGKVEAPYTVCIASASNLTGLVKSSVECRRTGL